MERKITFYEPQVPSDVEVQLAQNLVMEIEMIALYLPCADKLSSDTSFSIATNINKGKRLTCLREKGAWTFDSSLWGKERSRIKIAEQNETPLILFGLLGKNKDGKEDFVAWRRFEEKDEVELIKLRDALCNNDTSSFSLHIG